LVRIGPPALRPPRRVGEEALGAPSPPGPAWVGAKTQAPERLSGAVAAARSPTPLPRPPAGPTAPPPAPFERARSAGSNGAGLGPGGGLVGVLWPVEAGRRYPKARRRYPKAGPAGQQALGKGHRGPLEVCILIPRALYGTTGTTVCGTWPHPPLVEGNEATEQKKYPQG
jgi:hypothetical protein